jgi:hypothetical protein
MKTVFGPNYSGDVGKMQPMNQLFGSPNQGRQRADSPFKGISDITAHPSYTYNTNIGAARQYDPATETFDYDAQGLFNAADPSKVRSVAGSGTFIRGDDAIGYSLDPSSYQASQLSEGDLRELDRMNFDPYRRNALQDVESTYASGLAGAQSDLARSGGLTAADRMGLASEFNRQRIAQRQGALGKYDEMEARNIYDVGRANVDMYNRQQLTNLANRQQTMLAQSEAQTGSQRYAAVAKNQRAAERAAAEQQANQFYATAQNRARQQELANIQQAAMMQGQASAAAKQHQAEARNRQLMANMDAYNQRNLAQSRYEQQNAQFGHRSAVDRYKFGGQMAGAEAMATQQWMDSGGRTKTPFEKMDPQTYVMGELYDRYGGG